MKEDELKDKVEYHELALFGDKKLNKKGIMEVQQEILDKQTCIDKKIDNLIDMVGEVVVWKEGIQSAPKRGAKAVVFWSGVVGATLLLYEFAKQGFKKLFGLWP